MLRRKKLKKKKPRANFVTYVNILSGRLCIRHIYRASHTGEITVCLGSLRKSELWIKGDLVCVFALGPKIEAVSQLCLIWME